MGKILEFLGFSDSSSGFTSERTPPRSESSRDRTLRPVNPVRPMRSRHDAGYSVIHTMRPRRYQDDATSIAHTFAGGSPVIVDLSGMSDSDIRRLIDFMSGLVTGLDGTIRKVATKVFMLTPVGIEQFDDELDQNSLKVHDDAELLD